MAAGFLALALGALGIVIPLLPTVPFVVLAAFCFARSSPALEQRLLDHPRFGEHIHRWRARRAISRRGKLSALIAFGISAAVGVAVAPWPWWTVSLAACACGAAWIWTRPEV